MKVFKYLVFSTVLATGASCASAQNYDEGMAAYNAGDYKTAFNDLLPLAQHGDLRVMNTLAFLYFSGNGIVQEYAQALKWYREAAEKGDVISQQSIGMMYDLGKGVVQDNIRAHMWYNIASANGDTLGASFRAAVAERMTQDEIAKAQAMAVDCLNSGYKTCGW